MTHDEIKDTALGVVLFFLVKGEVMTGTFQGIVTGREKEKFAVYMFWVESEKRLYTVWQSINAEVFTDEKQANGALIDWYAQRAQSCFNKMSTESITPGE